MPNLKLPRRLPIPQYGTQTGKELKEFVPLKELVPLKGFRGRIGGGYGGRFGGSGFGGSDNGFYGGLHLIWKNFLNDIDNDGVIMKRLNFASKCCTIIETGIGVCYLFGYLKIELQIEVEYALSKDGLTVEEAVKQFKSFKSKMKVEAMGKVMEKVPDIEENKKIPYAEENKQDEITTEISKAAMQAFLVFGVKARNSYTFGDQYVHFNISIPANLAQRQPQLIEEFAKEEQGEYDNSAAAGASG